MSGEVIQFPKVSELAEAYAELLAANSVFMKLTEVPAYIEEHRLNAGVDMAPHIWLRYVLIKLTRAAEAGKSTFNSTPDKARASRKAAVRYIRLRRDRDENTG